MNKIFNWKHFVLVTLIISIWVNASEIFRYFIFVIPRVKTYRNKLESVADMSWLIFGIWGVWDTILTAMIVLFFWLYTRVFGNNRKSVFISGTLS